jgi:hypothetical protein
LTVNIRRKTIIVRRLLSSSPYLISFFAWSNRNSDVNMPLVYTLEFFDLFFNSLNSFAANMASKADDGKEMAYSGS